MPPPILPPSSASATPPLPQKKSWFGRNWKWMVPLVAILAIALLAGGIFAFVLGVGGLLKKSEAYQHPVAVAKAHPAVVKALGTPITEGLLPNGNIKLKNSDGEAKLEITLKGPKGEATLYVEAEKVRGKWHYDIVEIHLPATDNPLDLTQQANSARAIESF